MRLLLPTLPTPVFEKTAKLFKTLANYPAVAVVEVNGATYLFTHNGGGEFVIGKGKAAELYNALERHGIKARFKRNMLLLTCTQLEELARLGFAVRLLNDEKDAIREIKAVEPTPDLDAVRHVLIARIARIVVGTSRGRLCIKIIPYDRSKYRRNSYQAKGSGNKSRNTTREERGKNTRTKVCGNNP